MLNSRLAWRSLLSTPVVTLIAVVSLALGIGVNGAIFSLFEQMLLRDLPAQEPDRLVNLGAPGPKPGSTSCNNAGDCSEVFSYPMFRDLEREQKVFTGLGAHRLFGVNLSFEGQTRSGEGVLISGSYFPTLGLQPALGRLLGSDDDRVIGESRVVVLSHDYWRQRFDQSPDVLDRLLIVNGQSLTIVGVAPAGFRGTTLGGQPDVFVPITLRGEMTPGFEGFEDRRSYWAYVFARLAPGVSIDEARAGINTLYRAIITEVEAPLQEGMSDKTMERFRAREVTLEPGARGQSSLHQEARAPLVLLLSVTMFVLLIACANVANLLLARAADRGGEMALRLSVGASRGRLVSQLLAESLLLALLGGLAGLLVARWTMAGIGSLMPAEAVATVELGFDFPVIAFAALLSLGTGFVFGLFPALHSTRVDLSSMLKGQGGHASGARAASRVRTALVTVQIALSTMLLVSAGLFIRSLVNVTRVELGIEVDHLVTFAISPELNGYSPERCRALFEQAEAELAAVPGVTGVTVSRVPLLAGSSWGSSVRVQGFEADADTDRNSRFNLVGPEYFHTLGVPLLAGRAFTAADVVDSPKVAIVNQAFAKKFGLGRDAVGQRMAIGGLEGDLDIEIVGLVPNTKYNGVKDALPPLFFRPYRQVERIGSAYFYARTALAPEAVIPPLTAVISRLDPNLPVEELKTMPQQVRENVFADRIVATLSAGFALLATVLAAVGLYGLLAYAVAQRTGELGVRMALGADAGRLRLLVLAQVGKMTLVGALIGLAAALALGTLVRSQLFELEGHDPWVLAGATLLLCLVALGSGLVPAVRASRVDPMQALRYE